MSGKKKSAGKQIALCLLLTAAVDGLGVLLVTLLAHTKSSPLGSLETGKKHGNETEMEVLRLQVELDGEEYTLEEIEALLSASPGDFRQGRGDWVRAGVC